MARRGSSFDTSAAVAQRRVKAPKAGAEDKYEKIFGEFRFAEIELIAVFHLPGSGKIPDKVCELADVWLRRACSTRAPMKALEATQVCLST